MNISLVWFITVKVLKNKFVPASNSLNLFTHGRASNIDFHAAVQTQYWCKFEGNSNQWIYKAPFVKSLGFYVDGNLDWGEYIDHVIKKVSSGIAILKSSKNYLPQRTGTKYTV